MKLNPVSLMHGVISLPNATSHDNYYFLMIGKMHLKMLQNEKCYISQLISFARASSKVADFNTRNKLVTQKLLKQGYRYHKLSKTFTIL